MRERQKDLGAKFEKGKILTKKAEWINNMKKESRMPEEGPQVNIHPEGLKATLKEYQTGKPLAQMAYTDFGFKNSPPYTTDLLPKLIDPYRKLRYPNG